MGLAPEEIASEFGISTFTVRNHLKAIRTKLHVHTAVAAAAVAWGSLREQLEEFVEAAAPEVRDLRGGTDGTNVLMPRWGITLAKLTDSASKMLEGVR